MQQVDVLADRKMIDPASFLHDQPSWKDPGQTNAGG
jgi:hypothetical protein